MSWRRDPIWPAPRRLEIARAITAHADPILSQVSYRNRNDDGDSGSPAGTGASFETAENTDWTQPADELFRVRFEIAETNGGTSNNVQLRLQYQLNGGGWNPVPVAGAGTDPVEYIDSANLTDENTNTADLLTTATGALIIAIQNEWLPSTTQNAGANNQLDFAGNDHLEIEVPLTLVSSQISDGDTIQLRWVHGDSTVFAGPYTVPTITASVAAAAQTGDGVVASSPFSATAGSATQGQATGAGSTATAVPTATAGSVDQPASVSGSPASAPFTALAGSATLGGVIASGLVAAAALTALPGSVAPGAVVGDGSPASAPYIATTGSAETTSGGTPQTADGAVASVPFTALQGEVGAGAVSGGGAAVAAPFQATTGGAQVGAVSASGTVASAGVTALTGSASVEGGPQVASGSVAGVPFTAGAGQGSAGDVTGSGASAQAAFLAPSGAGTAGGVQGGGQAGSVPFTALIGSASVAGGPQVAGGETAAASFTILAGSTTVGPVAAAGSTAPSPVIATTGSASVAGGPAEPDYRAQASLAGMHVEQGSIGRHTETSALSDKHTEETRWPT